MELNAENEIWTSYTDRGVQTDDDLPSSPEPAQPTSTPSPQTSLPTNMQISSLSLLSPPQVAYTRSSRARASASRAYKYPELSSARPSSLYNPISDRVVSLPDTKPAKPIQVPTQRIVSLPESVLVSHKVRGLGISGSDPLYLSCEDETSFARVRVYPPDSEVPRTPSPPSSQESSIMIIGSDPNVPYDFLRHNKDLSEHYYDGAWSSWTTSPPRPIPALHGPLSLPYARCPSGAEGTLIEGSDGELPRMIWGLDGDSRQTFGSQKNISSNTNAKVPSSTHTSNYSKSRASDSQTGPYREPDIFVDTGGIVFETGTIERDWQYQLEEGGNLVVSDPSLKPGFPKSAAPPFVPPTARIFIEPRQTSHVATPRHRPSAAEIAQEYYRQQQAQQNNIPTPSSTFSSWTPALSSSSSLYEISPSLSSSGITDLSAPYTNLGQQITYNGYVDETQSLRQFVFDRINNPLPYQGNLSQELHYDQHSELDLSPLHSPRVSTRRNIDLKTAITMSQRQTPAPNTTSEKYFVNNTSAPPPPPSPQTSQKSKFQPRSVPLARLMQRTLCTVPEEDSLANQAGQRKSGPRQQGSTRTGLGIDLESTGQAWRGQRKAEEPSQPLSKKSTSANPRLHAKRVVSGSFDENGQSKASVAAAARRSELVGIVTTPPKLSLGKKKSNTKSARKNRVVSA